MGELREPWHSRQIELLDRHLQLLHLYSQAKEHLESHKGQCRNPFQFKYYLKLFSHLKKKKIKFFRQLF